MENVILLHGLWMNRWVMRILGNRLEYGGFKPIYFNYATTRANPREHARDLERQIRMYSLSPCHFVAHSLGGLILRHLVDIAPDLMQGRIVTLGTPHQGSSVARVVYDKYPSLIGKAWEIGLNGALPSWQGLIPLGNIAGTSARGVGRLLQNTLSKPNDGTVAVLETELALSFPLQIPCSHTGLLFDSETAEQTVYFLRHGVWNVNVYRQVNA